MLLIVWADRSGWHEAMPARDGSEAAAILTNMLAREGTLRGGDRVEIIDLHNDPRDLGVEVTRATPLEREAPDGWRARSTGEAAAAWSIIDPGTGAAFATVRGWRARERATLMAAAPRLAYALAALTRAAEIRAIGTPEFAFMLGGSRFGRLVNFARRALAMAGREVGQTRARGGARARWLERPARDEGEGAGAAAVAAAAD